MMKEKIKKNCRLKISSKINKNRVDNRIRSKNSKIFSNLQIKKMINKKSKKGKNKLEKRRIRMVRKRALKLIGKNTKRKRKELGWRLSYLRKLNLQENFSSRIIRRIFKKKEKNSAILKWKAIQNILFLKNKEWMFLKKEKECFY